MQGLLVGFVVFEVDVPEFQGWMSLLSGAVVSIGLPVGVWLTSRNLFPLPGGPVMFVAKRVDSTTAFRAAYPEVGLLVGNLLAELDVCRHQFVAVAALKLCYSSLTGPSSVGGLGFVAVLDCAVEWIFRVGSDA